MENLDQLRTEIGKVDDQIIALFARRMAISGEIARYKAAHGMEIFAPEREAQILAALEGKTTPEMLPYLRGLFQCLMDLSKLYQKALLPSSQGEGENLPSPEKPNPAKIVKNPETT